MKDLTGAPSPSGEGAPVPFSGSRHDAPDAIVKYGEQTGTFPASSARLDASR
ncbi:hypothetical protein EBESD8_53280 [Rhodococcus aetherivorans]|nr:hypothetical protein EBESD8_53280 [Rhodococcus aetherivorans]